jgi:ubiquilin
MADTAGAEDATVTFHVKSSGGQKFTVTLPLSTTTADLKNKLAGEEYANVPASAQRLIYSGKVLKDGDTLATHNVKEGNTMHLVKSAPSNQRQNPAAQSTGSTTSSGTPAAAGVAGVPQNLASGTGNDPLAGLTGARYAGFAQLPSASMFTNPQSPEDFIRQLEDPNFQQMMREAMNNPQVIDMMINQNPQLRNMPGVRQILQSDYFRRMMTDPQAIRAMMQMQGGAGMGGFGGGAQGAFPAPGVTNTTENAGDQTNNQTQQQQQQAPPNPFAAFGGGAGGMGANPFASLFQPQFPSPNQNASTPSSTNATGTGNEAGSPNPQNQQQQNPFAALMDPARFGQLLQPNNSGTTGPPPANPFGAPNPEAFNQLLQALGGGAGNEGANYGNPFDFFQGGGGAGAGQAAAADNRPPEERYATQLQQLNEMGFYDFDRNIQALRRTGGSVNGAIEYLLSNP